MIRRVLTEAEERCYLNRVADALCLGTAMEVRCRMFREVPQLGHQFWLSENAAIALSGDTASVVGEYDPEEMAAFLDFAGMQKLLTDGEAPTGWVPADTLYAYAVRSPLPVHCPGGMSIDRQPSLMTFTDLALSGEDAAAKESFYAQACAKRNHGMGAFWVASLNGTPVSAVAASEICGGFAYMSQGHTLPDFRGGGIGGALIAAMANSLLEQEVTPCWLCREERRHFYEAMGATCEKEYYLYKKKEL